VDDRGEGGRDDEADPTGDKYKSSKSGVSIISIGNENVVSSVRVTAGELEDTTPCLLPWTRVFAAAGTAAAAVVVVIVVVLVVVVAMLFIGLDSRRPRARLILGLFIVTAELSAYLETRAYMYHLTTQQPRDE
jgi:hypothetical protein